MARPRGTAALPATDLTTLHGRLDGLTGKPLVAVARDTLEAGQSLVGTWRELEPLVRALIERVKAQIVADDFDDQTAGRLLGLCATVVQKVGAAATGMLRATEGQTRLALLVEGPRVERQAPGRLTEKQLASVVLEVAKKIAAETGACPVCTVTVPAETVHGAAPDA